MGYLRFSLCLAVIYLHLRSYTLSGQTAVLVFFVLSSFLTSYVTTEIYNHGFRSKLAFLANRVVRIYPVYYACLAFASACLLLIHPLPNFHEHTHFPVGAYNWLKQFTILGISTSEEGRSIDFGVIVETAWSLSTEIFYYLIVGVLLGGRKWLTTCAFLWAVYYTIHCYNHRFTFMHFYCTIQGSVVAFMLGAACYYHRGIIKKLGVCRLVPAILLANIALYLPDFLKQFNELLYFTANISLSHNAGIRLNDIMISFCSLPLFAWIIVSLHQRQAKPSKYEQWLADISYPIFLIHIPATWIILRVQPLLGLDRWLFFACVVLFSMLLSTILVITVDRPLKKYRKLIRRKN